MCIDIVDVCCRKPCIAKRSIHYVLCTSAFRMWCRNMMRIPGRTATRDLTIYSCTPGSGVLHFFKDQCSCPFTHHKPVTALIIGTAGGLGTLISFTQCFHGIAIGRASCRERVSISVV